MQPTILVFAGSTRSGSLNRRLSDLAAARIGAAGGMVSSLDLRDYPLPLYDGDLEAASGVPEAAQRLHEQLRTSDGVFIASPEYNANVTPLLLNMIAWVSRVSDHGGMAAAFGRPVYAIGAASPGGFGGYRGLMALRNSLELQLKARVLPGMVSVASAHQAFDDTGDLKDARTRGMLDKLATQLVEVAASVRAG